MGHMVDIRGVDVYRADAVGPLRGGLILIEEIWGLVPHIRAVADRFAGEGYLVLAPELLGDVLGSVNGQELMEARNDPDEARRTAVQPQLRELFSGMQDPAFAGGAVAKLTKLVERARVGAGHRRPDPPCSASASAAPTRSRWPPPTRG